MISVMNICCRYPEDSPALGVMLVILLTPGGLMFFYYGLKAIISRKATWNSGGDRFEERRLPPQKTDYTGGRAVLIGTFLLVVGTALLAFVTPAMLCLYHVWQSS